MTEQPNILLVMTDEHSYRGLGYLDTSGRGEPVNTPALDEMAASSAVFDQTYCQMPACTPSRLSMLTGQEVVGAGAWTNWSTLLPGRTTMPERFGEAGYATSLVGKMHFGGNRQFGGFQDRPYGDLTGESGHQPDPIDPIEENKGRGLGKRIEYAGRVTEIPESLLQEQAVVTESLSWVREHESSNPDQPWFLCSSFSRPHFPLTAPRRYIDRYWPEGVTDPKVGPEGDTADHPVNKKLAERLQFEDLSEEETRKARAGYFACIDYIDEVIGDFLTLMDSGGFLDNTIVVFLSDHGELAGEHGLWWKSSWYEASARVPFMIQTPGHRTGSREPSTIETPVGLVDLFPTLCGLCDVDPPGSLDGIDLSESVENGVEPERGPVVCDNLSTFFGEGSQFRMVRDGDYKYVRFKGDYQDLLFDLEADPLETENLAVSPTDEQREILDRLRTFVDETMDFEAAEKQRREDVEKVEQNHILRSALDTDEDVSDFRRNVVKAVTPETTDGNLYQLPDGRVVDAGMTLYKPKEIIKNPGEAFDDWPDS